MCQFGDDIKHNFGMFRPRSKTDIDKLVTFFKQINQSVHYYIDTLNLGVKSGTYNYFGGQNSRVWALPGGKMDVENLE